MAKEPAAAADDDDDKEQVLQVFRAALDSVNPTTLVQDHLSMVGEEKLVVRHEHSYKVNRNVYVVAYGKAALGMSSMAAKILGVHMVRGIASVPKHTQREQYGSLPENLEVYEGAKNNLPDQEAYENTQRIEEMLKKLGAQDIVLVLVSGGGSALLPAPVPGVSLSDKQSLVSKLSMKGASISELNTVRQHLSTLKGGGLPNLAPKSKFIVLIFSDIMFNDLQYVASGATVPCGTSIQDAAKVLRRYCTDAEVPSSIREYMEGPGKTVEKAMIEPSRVLNILIGDNVKALEAAKRRAEMWRTYVFILGRSLDGDATAVGGEVARLVRRLVMKAPKASSAESFRDNHPLLTKECSVELIAEILQCLNKGRTIWLLWGGETTVQVSGSGSGGRNQQTVLAYIAALLKQVDFMAYMSCSSTNIVFGSFDTDGQDGPTDAAGAMVHSDQLMNMSSEVAEHHLSNNDSYHFFQRYPAGGKCLVKTGLTATNVMDILILRLHIENVW